MKRNIYHSLSYIHYRTLFIAHCSLFIVLFPLCANAQFPKDNPADEAIRTVDFPALKQLTMTPIDGAPVLSQPQRVDGSRIEIRTGKHGLCYPAVYDWNHDGLPDLLLGEFSTGDKENNIKVYINKGSRKKPKFTGEYFYAKDTNGDTISNHQWCCIGIHPRFADINGDGIPDMLSGQYNPGLISLWQGGKDGFLPRRFVDQEGYSKGNMQSDMDPRNPKCNLYWNYTSAGFADYDGDGLVDLFVGGGGGPRVALNVGTRENPKFGLRKYLYMTDGNILSINPDKPMRDGGQSAYYKTYMTPVDWDGDGVLDILMTYEYATKGSHAILFYKGVKTNLGLRFHHPVPLFTSPDGGKELPGCQPMICVADVNGDGINDIVMGLSVPTVLGVADQNIAWQWTHDLELQMPGKDAGEYYMYTTRDSIIARMEREQGVKPYYLGLFNDTKYIDLRHRGYVFVLYGHKNPRKAVAETMTLTAPKPVETRQFDNSSEPLTYQVSSEKVSDRTVRVIVTLKFKDGWHGYTNTKAATDMGMIPTTVSFSKSDGTLRNGPVSEPYVGGAPIYTGEVRFSQEYGLIKKGINPLIKMHVSYQACDANMCLPPAEHDIVYEIHQ